MSFLLILTTSSEMLTLSLFTQMLPNLNSSSIFFLFQNSSSCSVLFFDCAYITYQGWMDYTGLSLIILTCIRFEYWCFHSFCAFSRRCSQDVWISSIWTSFSAKRRRNSAGEERAAHLWMRSKRNSGTRHNSTAAKCWGSIRGWKGKNLCWLRTIISNGWQWNEDYWVRQRGLRNTSYV